MNPSPRDLLAFTLGCCATMALLWWISGQIGAQIADDIAGSW